MQHADRPCSGDDFDLNTCRKVAYQHHRSEQPLTTPNEQVEAGQPEAESRQDSFIDERDYRKN